MTNTELDSILRKALSRSATPFEGLTLGMGMVMANGLNVGLDFDEARAKLVLWCSLGELPQEVPGELYEFLLSANLLGSRTGGGHIGLYTPSRTVLFSLSLDADALDENSLANAFDRFTEKASSLMEETARLCLPQSESFDISLMASAIWA